MSALGSRAVRPRPEAVPVAAGLVKAVPERTEDGIGEPGLPNEFEKALGFLPGRLGCGLGRGGLGPGLVAILGSHVHIAVGSIAGGEV